MSFTNTSYFTVILNNAFRNGSSSISSTMGKSFALVSRNVISVLFACRFKYLLV